MLQILNSATVLVVFVIGFWFLIPLCVQVRSGGVCQGGVQGLAELTQRRFELCIPMRFVFAAYFAWIQVAAQGGGKRSCEQCRSAPAESARAARRGWRS